MRGSWAGAVVGGLLALGLASASAAAPTAEALYPAVRQALESGRCDLPTLKRIVAAPDFKDFESSSRSFSYLALAACDQASATKWVKLATAEPGAMGLAWRIRFAIALVNHDPGDALASLETLAARPDDGPLNLAGDIYISELARQTRDDPQAYLRFLMVLDRADWRPAQTFNSGDALWVDLVRRLLDAGDNAGAARVAARVRDTRALLAMSLDKRFDAVVAANPSRFDIVAAAQAELETHRGLLASRPGDGHGIEVVAENLLLTGRHAEALAFTEAALKQPGPLADESRQDKRAWVLNARASALKALGRLDEAVAAMREGAAQKEMGRPNVSQTINLAGYLNAAGRYPEVIATLASLPAGAGVSGYGNMWVAAERTCAFYHLNRTGDAERALAFTKDHAKDNRSARAKALVCASDMDGLAAEFVARLQDPNERGRALIELSNFSAPDALTPPEIEAKRRLDDVRARPGVRAAVAAVGRTADLPLFRGSLMDLY